MVVVVQVVMVLGDGPGGDCGDPDGDDGGGDDDGSDGGNDGGDGMESGGKYSISSAACVTYM